MSTFSVSNSACVVFRHALPCHAYTHYLPSNSHISTSVPNGCTEGCVGLIFKILTRGYQNPVLQNVLMMQTNCRLGNNINISF